MKKKVQKPVSLRINEETRAVLDYLIKKTGLKQADLIRLSLRRLLEYESRTDPDTVTYAAKPAPNQNAKRAK